MALKDPQTEATRDVVRRFTIECEADFPLADPGDESWKERMWAVFEELVHPDVILHGVSGLERGARPWYDRFVSVGEAFPDSESTIDVIHAEGDLATIVWSWTGTHVNEVMGAPPTGKVIELQAILVQRVDDGKVVEHWVGFDSMRWLEQLGAIDSSVAALGRGHTAG